MQAQLAQHVFDHSQQLILTLDAEGHILSINPFACELLGQTEHQLLGQNWVERYVPVDEQNALKRHLQEVHTLQLTHVTYHHHVMDHTGHLHAFNWHHGFLHTQAQQSQIACLGQDVTELEDTQKRLSYIKDYDKLTQLPKMELFKEMFEHALQMAKRYHHKLALFFIDIDNLKIINDRYGHHVGDELIQFAAKSLNSLTSDNHTLASFGGDEFVLLIENADTQEIFKHCEQISALFMQPFNTQVGELMMSCSMGISLYPEDGLDCNTLMQYADIAKNRAKEDGKNQFHFYRSGMDAEISQIHVMELELKKAIKNNEFELYFQPQVDHQDRHLMGVEALIRWNNPLLGSVSPAEFIPFAEKSSLIIPIGEWVLTNALEQHLKWKAQGFVVPISINVSPKQLENPGFIELVMSLPQRYPDLDLSKIELEITETSMVKNPEESFELLKRINSLGIKIAIDDFGTGYSSFASLKRGAFHKVKIDRSFVNQLHLKQDDAVIVTAIIRMAETLGLTIIAEGVEHEEQTSVLSQLGCRQIQGFLYGHPMPADQIVSYMNEHFPLAQTKAPGLMQ
jgi:diguanylate cyclase (GGDEF)-like protein/PAS domain S-box-containing protein